MAEAKTTKANLTLAEQLTAKRADLLVARQSLYAGTLENPHSLKTLRRDIARLLTQINQEKGAK